MPVSFKYNREKDILLIVLIDEVVLSDIDLLYNDIVTSTEFPPDTRSIWDFRETDFSLIDINFMQQVFSIRQKYPERGNARAAFVADNDLAYGVTRMYQVLSSFGLPQHIRVFREFREAEDWIVAEK